MPVESKTTDIPTDPHARSCGAFVGYGFAGVTGPLSVNGCWVIATNDPDPINSIERVLRDEQQPGCRWAIMLGYELGGCVEPKARSGVADDLNFPFAVVQRLGDPIESPPRAGAFEIGSLRSSTGRDAYLASVRRAREYIAAGDVYQVNLAHHLIASFHGSIGACTEALMRAAKPRYGAMMRFEHEGRSHTVCSLSPELFLRFDRSSGVLRTQPMKGTRPLDGDERELEQSPKDRAELNMITDLMRNDIGRVCRPGSVRVVDARRIEPHASGVLQASSIIEGVASETMGLGELIRATFPPGSVTGAPKVRAMQIIDEIEQHPRRSYCGSILSIDQLGNIEASVAIRTAHIWGVQDHCSSDGIVDGWFDFPVGAGIVTDSDPSAEWEETLVKAGVLRSALGLNLSTLG